MQVPFDSGSANGCKPVWLDMEMTGLYPDVHSILEVGLVVTDWDLNIIDQFPDKNGGICIHHPDWVLDRIDRFSEGIHKASGLLERCNTDGLSLQEAEHRILTFLKKHFPRKEAVLVGNTVWQDRIFLRRYMPEVESYLHHRVVDVSSIRVILEQWFPDGKRMEKKKEHRVMSDIQEAIAELRFYGENFLGKKTFRVPGGSSSTKSSSRVTPPS